MQIQPAFIGNLGATEILLILFIVLLLFGAKKLPELARGLGRSLEEFRRAARDVRDEVTREVPPPPAPSKSNAPAPHETPPPPPGA